MRHGGSGFWIDICRQHLKDAHLLIQGEMEELDTLVNASSLPAFHSDRALEQGHRSSDRVVLPICDPAITVTYYLACLRADVHRYASLFQAACKEMK